MISSLSSREEWFAIPVCHAPEVLGKTYYHFFFGVLMPLLDLARQGTFEGKRIYILSCGMFNPILKELIEKNILNLWIVPEMEVIRRLAKQSDIGYFVLDSTETYFHRHGRFCIRPAATDGDRFRSIAEFAKKHFPARQNPCPDVWIISRSRGEIGHGQDTRDLPNIGEIIDALTDRHHTVEVLTLEGRSIADQISIFGSAKIVIAQHGSSLSNMVWMQPTRGSVIELVPPDFRRDGWKYFELLSNAMHIRRIQISQKNNWAPVDPYQIIKAVESLQI